MSRVIIIVFDGDRLKPTGRRMRKDDPMTVEYETKAKNLLKAELKRRGVTYADLAAKLGAMGIPETEKNINNKIARGGFTAAFMIQCLEAIEAKAIRLED